jgi:hypothetical protein
MSFLVNVTEQDLYTALRAFLLVAAEGEVVDGQDNLVGLPNGVFCYMTTLRLTGLSTNKTEWNALALTEANSRSTEWACQLDFYSDTMGPGGTNAWSVAQLIRTSYAYDFFADLPAGVQPLYATDPINTTMINGEAQYQERYTLEFHAQFNPVVTTPLAFADTLSIGIVEVDAKFPPGD